MNKSWKTLAPVKVYKEQIIDHKDIEFPTSEEYRAERRRKGIPEPDYTYDRTETNKMLKANYIKAIGS